MMKRGRKERDDYDFLLEAPGALSDLHMIATIVNRRKTLLRSNGHVSGVQWRLRWSCEALRRGAPRWSRKSSIRVYGINSLIANDLYLLLRPEAEARIVSRYIMRTQATSCCSRRCRVSIRKSNQKRRRYPCKAQALLWKSVITCQRRLLIYCTRSAYHVKEVVTQSPR